MDQAGVNPMAMQPMSMPMGMSMPMAPMSSANGGPNPAAAGPNGVPMAMGVGPMVGHHQYGMGVGVGVGVGVPPQQAMMMGMNGMPMNAMNPMMKMPMAAGGPVVGGGGGPMAPMNPSASGGIPGGVIPGQPGISGTDWRIQVTREHRANLIAKIYNELVRVSSEPPPGIKLWMNVAWYELQLYKESRTQEDYISKIFNRLKTLRAQQTDMNAAMNAQNLPNNGLLQRLDFSYYNNMNPRAGQPPQQVMAPGQPQPGYPGGMPQQQQQFPGHPGAGNGGPNAPQPGKSNMAGSSGMATPGAMKDGMTPRSSSGQLKPEGAPTGGGAGTDNAAEYWRQHAALKSKYHEDVEKVHSAFKKYVDHMKDQNETDQKKKLRYLLSYVQLCASVLSEDKSTHQPRKLEELDKVYKYIVKIVNPYLKKLRTETDKRTFGPPGSNGTPNGMPSGPTLSPGAPQPSPSLGQSSGQQQPGQQQRGQQGIQNSSGSSQGQQSAQNNQQRQQQQYQQQQQQQLQQQRQTQQPQQQAQPQQQPQQQQLQQLQQQQQQLQQQQRLQLARQQMQLRQQQQQQQQQQMLQQQSQQQKPGQPPQQVNAQGGNQPKPTQSPGQQQSSQPTPSQSPGQHHRQQQPQAQQQQQQQGAGQKNQGGGSRGANSPSSLGSGLGLTLDDTSLYSGMDSSLLQMPGNLSATGPGSGFSFGSDLSPTTFSGSMDLGILDMDGSGLSSLSYDGQESSSGAQGGGSGSSGGANDSGDGSDLMNFVEAL